MSPHRAPPISSPPPSPDPQGKRALVSPKTNMDKRRRTDNSSLVNEIVCVQRWGHLEESVDFKRGKRALVSPKTNMYKRRRTDNSSLVNKIVCVQRWGHLKIRVNEYGLRINIGRHGVNVRQPHPNCQPNPTFLKILKLFNKKLLTQPNPSFASFGTSGLNIFSVVFNTIHG